MFEENENQNLALGMNDFEKATDEKLPEVVLTDEGYFGKPEQYDYSDVQLPTNDGYDEALLNEFNELAAKYNLSQKSANELMSMAVKLTQLTDSNILKAQAEQHRQTIEHYKRTLINDSEIGGANFERTMKTANIAYTQFADEEVQKLLQETGLNCHPQVVKMFYNIGLKMQNDFIYGANAAAVQKENREDILFPTM